MRLLISECSSAEAGSDMPDETLIKTFSVGRGEEFLENDEETVRLEETLKAMSMKRLKSPAGECDQDTT